MNRLIKLFMCEYEIYLTANHEYDPLQHPKRLIAELDPQNPDNVLRHLLYHIQEHKGPNRALKTMHKLTLISLLILHSDKFYEQFSEILPLKGNIIQTGEDWIASNFLHPYQQFLLRCCTSSEIYSKVKSKYTPTNSFLEYSFDTVFYTINLLNKLFLAVEKISQLGRYYDSKGGNITKLYTLVAAAQAMRLYTNLKTVVLEMVNHPEQYIPNRESERLMKSVLGEYLVSINENMKSIVLNKYYAPYKHGIIAKLFRNEEQQQKTFKVINGILNSHRDTQRQQQRETRQKTLMEYTNLMNKSLNSNTSFVFNPKVKEFSINVSTYGMSTMNHPFKSKNISRCKKENQSSTIVLKRPVIIQHEFNNSNQSQEEEQQKHNNKVVEDGRVISIQSRTETQETLPES